MNLTEYLCDYCDSVFSSSYLVSGHQKWSCLGVPNAKNERDEQRKAVYQKWGKKRCEDCRVEMGWMTETECSSPTIERCEACQEEERLASFDPSRRQDYRKKFQ